MDANGNAKDCKKTWWLRDMKALLLLFDHCLYDCWDLLLEAPL